MSSLWEVQVLPLVLASWEGSSRGQMLLLGQDWDAMESKCLEPPIDQEEGSLPYFSVCKYCLCVIDMGPKCWFGAVCGWCVERKGLCLLSNVPAKGASSLSLASGCAYIARGSSDDPVSSSCHHCAPLLLRGLFQHVKPGLAFPLSLLSGVIAPWSCRFKGGVFQPLLHHVSLCPTYSCAASLNLTAAGVGLGEGSHVSHLFHSNRAADGSHERPPRARPIWCLWPRDEQPPLHQLK